MTGVCHTKTVQVKLSKMEMFSWFIDSLIKRSAQIDPEKVLIIIFKIN